MIRKRLKQLLSGALVLGMLTTYSGNEIMAAGMDSQPVASSQETEEKTQAEQAPDSTDQDVQGQPQDSGEDVTDTNTNTDTTYTDTLDALYSEDLPAEEVEEIAEELESDYSRVGQSSIAELLEEYRAVRDQVYTGETLSESENMAPQILSFESARSERIRAMEEESQIRFTKADTTFQVQDQRDSGDQIILTVYEWVFLTYNNGADICGYGFDHVMTVTKKGDHFYLESDAYADGSLGFVASPDSTSAQQQDAGLLTADTSVLQDSLGESTEENAGASAYAASKKYSADSAVSYSNQYATSYNGNYSNYNSVGGDCANFVSQCIAAGGLGQTSGWYYNSYNNRSSSWIYCPTQRAYMATQGTLIDNPSTSQIKRGNPIWYYKNGTYAHAAFCVGTNSAGTPIINAHNNDHYHAIWNLGGASSGWSGYSTVQIQVNAHNPNAFLDKAEGDAKSVYVKGWAFDGDAPSKALDIHVYVGGPAGSGAPGYEIHADKSRPDVGKAYPGMGDNHGFEDTIPVTKTGSQKIYVYAINEGGGTNVLINTKTVTIKTQVSTPTKVTSVKLDKSILILKEKGDKEKLTATVLPESAANRKVTWSSSKPEVATVGTSGTVTAVSQGEAVITALTQDGRKLASCTVFVAPDISKAVLTGVESKNYTGSPLTQPDLAATFEGITLVKDKDYSITYQNNTKIGTATVTLEGIGSYKGTVSKTFRIIVVKGKTYQVGDLKYKMTYTNPNGKGTVTLTGTTKSRASLTSLSVPKTVNIGGKHYKVTAIQNDAFKAYRKLTKLTVGSNVTIIGSSAFAGCTSLSTATIGTGLTKLGYKAFYNCHKLNKLTIKSTRLSFVGIYSIKNIGKTATLQTPNSKRTAYKQKFNAKTGFKDTMKLY